MRATIYSITKVEVSTTAMTSDTPPALVITAVGLVNSGGWSKPALDPFTCITIPSDGILDLTFSAEPPSPGSIVTAGFTPIMATIVMAIPSWVRGVRIHSSTNSMMAMIGEAAAAIASAASSDDVDPKVTPNFPWFRPLSEGAPASFLPLFDLKMSLPDVVYVNLMPPVPSPLIVPVHVTLVLSNNSGKDELLTAPTPCAIHDWDLNDEGGRLVDSKKDELCIQMFQTRLLESGASIRSDYIINLNGKLLANGGKYLIRFRFWRFEAERAFEVKHVF